MRDALDHVPHADALTRKPDAVCDGDQDQRARRGVVRDRRARQRELRDRRERAIGDVVAESQVRAALVAIDRAQATGIDGVRDRLGLDDGC